MIMVGYRMVVEDLERSGQVKDIYLEIEFKGFGDREVDVRGYMSF